MDLESLAWVSNALDLPTWLVGPSGALSPNAAAGARLQDVPRDLEEALALLCAPAAPPDATTLAHLLEAARAGTAQTQWLADGSSRLLFIPTAANSVLVVAQVQPATPAARPVVDTEMLAAGVAHELANALNAIAGWAQLARQGRRIDEALAVIERSALQGGASARHMLAQLRGQDARTAPPEVLDVTEMVRDVARLLAPAAQRARVEVQVEAEPEQHVWGVRPELWAVCWNLALNAVQAMSATGGSLRLGVRAVHDEATDAAQVLIDVQDTGPGMDPALQARVLDPYFTTKADGSGIGLTWVQRAVTGLAGKLRIASEPDCGTCISVYIPAHAVDRAEEADSLLPKAAADSYIRVRAGSMTSSLYAGPPLDARILVVDDDAGMRDLMATTLSMRGAEVVTADGLDAALSTDGRFDLAIVDLLLPGTSGDRLLAHLRDAGRVGDALMVTGLEAPTSLAVGGEPQGWLRKPFQLEDLFEQVHALIDSASASSKAALAT